MAPSAFLRIDFLGAAPESLDELEAFLGRHRVGEEQAQQSLVAELESRGPLAAQPFIEGGSATVGQAIGLPRAGAVRVVGADDVLRLTSIEPQEETNAPDYRRSNHVTYPRPLLLRLA